MQTRSDLGRKPSSGKRRRKTPRRPGGKVLQRLFTFLGQRDPGLNDDVVATVPVPKTVRPNYALTAKALRAKPVTAKSVARRRIRRQAVCRHHREGRGAPHSDQEVAARKRKTAPPAGTPGVWQEIGPRRIPDGQTYGSNRVDVAGRVSAIAIDPNDPAHVVLAAAGGGIWETPTQGRPGSRARTRCRHWPSARWRSIRRHPRASTRAAARAISTRTWRGGVQVD